MSTHSAIEWTDATWNPTTGCTKISPGCAHCYIERTPAFRIAGNRFEHGKTDIAIFHDRLAQPLHWRKPRRVFVNSLSDLFHDDISDAFIGQVFDVMAQAARHTFQLLTKRPERMRTLVPTLAARHTARDGSGWPLPNVWLGVSVENQHFADSRIPLLLQTPAAVRFISAEPLLGPVDLARIPLSGHPAHFDALSCYDDERDEPLMRGAILDWVIVGGESGPGARPFDLAWARAIVAQCKAAGVPVFVKQLGADPRDAGAERDDMGARDVWPAGWMATIDGRRVWRPDLTSRKGGDPAEWPEDLRVRQFPALMELQS